MRRYVLRRVVSGTATLVLVASLAFFLVRLTGDPAILLAGDQASAEQIEAIRRTLGTDRPLVVQYLDYVANAVQGDFGSSLFQSRPALEVVVDRLPATILLVGTSLVLATIVAVPLGVVSAMKPNSFTDWVARVIAALGQCVPVFWFGILLILIFSVQLRVLPSGGYGTWQHLVMPAASLSILTIPVVMRVLRSSLLEALSSDYIQMVYAKGASRRRVLFKHALRNAAVPVLTVMGYRLGFVLGGSVVTETVFSYPGVGLMAISAVLDRDFAVIQTFLVVVAAMIVTINLLIDLTYVLLDRRISYVAS